MHQCQHRRLLMPIGQSSSSLGLLNARRDQRERIPRESNEFEGVADDEYVAQ